MSFAANTETSEVYLSVIDRTFDVLRKDSELSTVRRDVLDRIKRQWSSSLNLDPNRPVPGASPGNSDPSAVVNRSKYMTLPASSPKASIAVESAPIEDLNLPVPEVDEYADEFEDSEFVSSTKLFPENIILHPHVPVVPTRRVVVEKKKELINVEELNDDLEDTEYDSIPEVSDCGVRIFGQTEVCESTVGSRRSDSKWMVTVLNGFLRDENEDEFLFRTAKQTMGHLHHHS